MLPRSSQSTWSAPLSDLMALIVFDLDGTLVDSQRDLAESANELLALFGAPPLDPARVAAMVGDGARVLVDRVLAAGGVAPRQSALEDFLEIYRRRLVVHTRFYPSVLEMLPALADRATLAIVTNKPERLSRALLKHFDAERLFRWIVGGDSGFPRKPHPAGLLHVVREWGRSAGLGQEVTASLRSRVLFVGDSQVDVTTARNAGVAICLAGYGFGGLRGDVSSEHADLTADRPEELRSLLTSFVQAAAPTRPPG